MFSNITAATNFDYIWSFWETKSLPSLFPYTDPSTGKILPHREDSFVAGNNLLIGQVRIRQLRIIPQQQCYIINQFNGTIQRCPCAHGAVRGTRRPWAGPGPRALLEGRGRAPHPLPTLCL